MNQKRVLTQTYTRQNGDMWRIKRQYSYASMWNYMLVGKKRWRHLTGVWTWGCWWIYVREWLDALSANGICEFACFIPDLASLISLYLFSTLIFLQSNEKPSYWSCAAYWRPSHTCISYVYAWVCIPFVSFLKLNSIYICFPDFNFSLFSLNLNRSSSWPYVSFFFFPQYVYIYFLLDAKQ